MGIRDRGDDRLFVNLFWNQYDDSELRWKDEYGDLGDQVLSTSASGMVVNEVKHDAETRVREETRTIAAFNLGYETELSEWAIDSMVSYSFAEEDDSNNAEANLSTQNKNGDKGTTNNLSTPQAPYPIAAGSFPLVPTKVDLQSGPLSHSTPPAEQFGLISGCSRDMNR